MVGSAAYVLVLLVYALLYQRHERQLATQAIRCRSCNLASLQQHLDWGGVGLEAGYTTCVSTTLPGSIPPEGCNCSLRVACHTCQISFLFAEQDVMCQWQALERCSQWASLVCIVIIFGVGQVLWHKSAVFLKILSKFGDMLFFRTYRWSHLIL